MQFPECGSIVTCPKCAALDAVILTIFHELPQPLGAPGVVLPDPCTKLVMETPSEDLEDFEQHLCRRCRRCGFGWVEQVQSERSVYDPPEETDEELSSPPS